MLQKYHSKNNCERVSMNKCVLGGALEERCSWTLDFFDSSHTGVYFLVTNNSFSLEIDGQNLKFLYLSNTLYTTINSNRSCFTSAAVDICTCLVCCVFPAGILNNRNKKKSIR